MKKLIVMIAAVTAAFSVAASHADSTQCTGSSIPSAEGISVHNYGDITGLAGTLYVCNDGRTLGPNGDVPVPAKGHAEVGGKIDQGDPAKSEGRVYVDGDANNRVDGAPDCTDGFVAVDIKANGDEPAFYNGGDGNMEDTRPNQANDQPAQKKSADEFAQSTAEECQ